jgi:hypothetical protein
VGLLDLSPTSENVMTWIEFLFGEQHWHSILGWHVAIAIALVIGWNLKAWTHLPKNKK